MSDAASTTTSGRLINTGDRGIGQQIKLPLSKAFEISYNSVRIRFKRSLITAGGIVLAIAFLMATLSTGKVVSSLKTGIPPAIGAIKKEQAAQIARAQEHYAGVKLGDKAKAFEKELAAGDFKKALGILDGWRADSKNAAAAGSTDALQDDLKAGVELSDDLGALNKMRIKLLERGEVPEEEGSQNAAGGAAAAGNSEETSRTYWLIGLALLVALVGIMNSMLMSVTERFREIGTMKCLGALDAFIVKLFLIESGMMGFLGTFFGAVAGLIVSLLKLHYDFGSGIFSFVPWNGIAMSALVTLGVGVLLALLGAIVPAFLAAQMEPVTAMRVDQ